MTGDEFWHGEPHLAESYRDADRMRRQKEDADAWKAGYYHLLAIAAVMDSDFKYPEEPLFTQKTEEQLEEAEEQRKRGDLAKMEAFAAAFNAKFAEKGE